MERINLYVLTTYDLFNSRLPTGKAECVASFIISKFRGTGFGSAEQSLRDPVVANTIYDNANIMYPTYYYNMHLIKQYVLMLYGFTCNSKLHLYCHLISEHFTDKAFLYVYGRISNDMFMRIKKMI